MSETKFTKAAASEVLLRLDTMATQITEKFASMGLDEGTAKALVNDLDRVADIVEASSFGSDSLAVRQVEVLKQAKVLQQESDESYMKTFDNPMSVHQQDADEGYMSAFKDDQSSAVISGKSETGRPLAPLDPDFRKAHNDDYRLLEACCRVHPR